MHLHLVGIYDTTTIVQFECQARGDLSQNTLPSSSSSSSELKQSILCWTRYQSVKWKMPQGYIRPPRVLFSILYQLSMARQAGEDVGSFGGLAYLKTIPIWGCQQKKPSLRKRMADLQLLCSLHTAPYCCCSFFQVCTLGRFFWKDCLQHIWHCSSWICKSHLYISLCCRYP